MKKSLLITILLAIILTGCTDAKKQTFKPIDQHLIPTRAEWKLAYGDTIETQVAYNLAVLRNDQKAIFNLVQSYHAEDPNEVAIEKLRVYESPDSVYAWRFDVHSKINKIIDKINPEVKK